MSHPTHPPTHPCEKKNPTIFFQVEKIIGFAPALLQIVMNDQVDPPVRQAGAIYFKNLVGGHWMEKEVVDPRDAANLHFSIHEQDRWVGGWVGGSTREGTGSSTMKLWSSGWSYQMPSHFKDH